MATHKDSTVDRASQEILMHVRQYVGRTEDRLLEPQIKQAVRKAYEAAYEFCQQCEVWS